MEANYKINLQKKKGGSSSSGVIVINPHTVQKKPLLSHNEKWRERESIISNLREGRKALTNFIQYLLSADQKIKNM